jgi:hypothetical protein
MRRVFAVFSVAAMVTTLAGAAHGTGYDGIYFDSDRNTSMDPHATTNGQFWIDTGSGPALLENDVNAQLLCGTSAGSLSLLYNPASVPGSPLVHGPQYSTLLLSDGTANEDITFFGDGSFLDQFGVTWVTMSPPYTSTAYFQLTAWTGLYNTYADAYVASANGTAGVYIAQTPVFSNPVADLSGDPIPAPLLYDMPAVLLARGLMGDANMDGQVDINDLTVVLTNYGQTTGESWSQGDFNGDGKVDINDLTVVLTNYGKTMGSAADARMAPVPEPGALALLATGFAGLMAIAWRKRS